MPVIDVLADVLAALLILAAIFGVMTFIGWLAVQWLGNIHYLFRKEDKHDDRDRH